MPQIDDFEEDDFEPDDDFEADDFEPDPPQPVRPNFKGVSTSNPVSRAWNAFAGAKQEPAPKASDFENVKLPDGSMISKRKGVAKGVGERPGMDRPDTNMFSVNPQSWENLSNYFANQIGTSKIVPDWAREGMGEFVDLWGVQVPRTVIDMISSPESVVTPGLLGGKKPPIPQPKPSLARVADAILDPEVVPSSRRLGAGRFVAGPGGVERELNIRPPHESGRPLDIDLIQGEPVPPFGGHPPQPQAGGTRLDLDELREQERLKNIFYTQYEQPGLRETLGTRMDVPDLIAGHTRQDWIDAGYNPDDVIRAVAEQERDAAMNAANREWAKGPELPNAETQWPDPVAPTDDPALLDAIIAEQRRNQTLQTEWDEMHAPPVTGDTRLGFADQSRAGQQLDPILGEPQAVPDMPYPYNVVPERLRPRTNQAVTQALVPERMSGPIPPESGGGIEMGTAPSTMPKPPESFTVNQPDTLGGTRALSPDEPILPSAVPKWRTRPHTQEASRTTPVGSATPEQQVVNNITRDVDPAIPGAGAEAAKIADQNRGVVRELLDGFMVSGEKQMERLGPIGTKIRRVLSEAEYRKRELYNKWAEPYLNTVRTLAKEEWDNFVDTMDGTAEALTPGVQKAVAAARALTDEMAQMAEAAGVRLKTQSGKIVPFKGLQKYWPRRPVNPMNSRRFVDEIMKNNPGTSRSKAKELAQKYMSDAEWFNSPQHARAKQSFEWRRDLSAMTDHIADMADIVARAEKLGAGDIGNNKSLISQLAEQSGDPDYAVDLIKAHLRGQMDAGSKWNAVKRMNTVLTEAQVFTKLSLFMFSNINNQLPTLLHGSRNVPGFIRSAAEATFGGKALRTVAKEYGTRSVGELPVEMISEMGKRRVPLVGNTIQWAENWARTVATGVGRGNAKIMFKAAKAGDKTAVRQLQDLLLTNDIADVLKQTDLNPEQTKFATQRFVELSQQLASGMKLPPMWATEPGLQSFLIFKKFGFQGTKSIKDAIMADPKRNIPMFLIASPLLGELTGDLKSLIYGASRGVPMPDDMINTVAFELAGRHRFADKITGLDSDESDTNWLVNRLAADMIQSWGLGLAGDFLQGVLGGENAGYSAVFGPAWDDVISGLVSAGKTTQGLATGDLDQAGQGATELGRMGIRSIPFVGPGLQRRLLPTESQEMP